MKKTFESEVVGHGPAGAWVYIGIPFNVEEVFGKKALVPVTGTINGIPFRNSLMPRGDGTHHMHLNQELLGNAEAKVGESVKVVMELDTATRAVSIPDDLQAALKQNASAGSIFTKLSYSHQKEYVDWINSAKRPETRSKRIADLLRILPEKKPRK